MDLSSIKELNLDAGKTKFFKKEVLDIYYRVLSNSNQWDLGLGYFSLSSIKLLSYPLAKFIVNNRGKVRLYCNERFSENDYNLLSSDVNSIYEVGSFTKNLQWFYKALSGIDNKLFANCVSYLIQNDLIDIRVLICKHSSRGISHTKNSIFRDNKDNVVVLSGSANVSEQAFLFNREDTSAFCSFWNEKSSNNSIGLTINEFDSTFYNGDEDWEIVTLNSKKLEEKIKQVGFRKNPDLDDIEKLCSEYVEKKELPFSDKINEEIQKEQRSTDLGFSPNIQNILAQVETKESFNFPFHNLRDYQKESVEEWKKNGFSGILAMATGTGKTYSAFGAIYEVLKNKHLIVFICCPFQHLVVQWALQIKKFGVTPIEVYSGTNWKKTLPIKLRNFNSQNSPLIIVATNNSLLPKNKFSRLMRDHWKRTFFISDEAHSLGSGHLRTCLPEESPVRLALSATIDRYFDDTGTDALKSYFRGVVYELPLKDAIGKFLVEYYYHAVPVELEEDKFDRYIKLSTEISRLAQYDDPEAEEKCLKLMLLRARLSNNCRNKLTWLNQHFNPEAGLKHTLFYVGDEIFEDTIRLLSRNKNIVASAFYGQTSNAKRKEILDQFGDGVIKCLVAMKCLDEGVDVPATRTAYFLASSGNPKEFVQRRGRVLRKSEETGKNEARLYDLISVPPSIVDKKHEHYNASRSLLISEFKRIREFAGLAKNKYQSLDLLKGVISRFNLYDQIE